MKQNTEVAQRRSALKPSSIIVFLLISLSFPSIVRSSSTGISCNVDADCKEKLLTPGSSFCDKNGYCTNPFEEGCLKAMGETYGKKNLTRIEEVFDVVRVCNSDDERRGDKSMCRDPDLAKYFKYDEMRIVSAGWNTIMLHSLMIQILLTEVAGVPATIEQGFKRATSTGKGSFYDRECHQPHGDYEFDHWKTALPKSVEVKGDCSKTEDACAHINPDAAEFFDKWMIDKFLKGTYFS